MHSAVMDVTLNDESVTTGSFEIVAGLPSVSFATIAPGGNATHR
jgi:hypothetical protein